MNRMAVKSTGAATAPPPPGVALGHRRGEQGGASDGRAVLSGAVSQEEWRKLVLSTGGRWQGEFERPEQGEYEAPGAAIVTHLLDTNSWIDHLRRGPNSNVTARLAAASPGSVCLCSLSLGDLLSRFTAVGNTERTIWP